MTLALDVFIWLVGILLHGSMKWAEYRQTTAKVGLVAYVSEVPAQTMVALTAGLGAFTVMYAMDWMNPGMAFACGYMGNSIAENLANRFAQVPKQ